MRTFISIPLSGLFVFLAGFNVWIMLTGRGPTPRSRKVWTQIHRVCGYIFIALFVIFCYFMLLRIRSADELSPRVVLHLSMALILAPLLLVKILVVRYQKAAWNLLITLGITIFAIAFTLVSMNVAAHYLRDVAPHKVPLIISLRVVALVVILAIFGFFTKSRTAIPKASVLSSTSTSFSVQPRDAPEEALNLTLARIETQTHDARTLRFILAAKQQIAPRPGQFLTFDWMVDGKLVKRSYTISSSPTQRNFVEITPKRVENGLVSKFLNDLAPIGMVVKARGPYGRFYFDESQHERVVLIAGGSGITPMVAMLRYIDDLCLKVQVTLIYFVRTERDIIFEDQIMAIESRVRSFRHVLVLSQPGAQWNGWRGRLRREILEREVEQPLDSTYFLCGPPAFMELCCSLLKQMTVEPSRVLQESFGGGITDAKAVFEATGPLEVKLSRSSITYRTSDKESLLESSERNGVLIPFGCRQGNCGTCATRLLSGNVQMANEEGLTEQMRAHGFILPCVSRPISDISLDV